MSASFKLLQNEKQIDKLNLPSTLIDICTYLMEEELMNPNSSMKIYFDSLQLELDTLTDAYSRRELMWLKGSQIHKDSLKLDEDIIADY